MILRSRDNRHASSMRAAVTIATFIKDKSFDSCDEVFHLILEGSAFTMESLPSSRMILARELEPYTSESARMEWDDNLVRPIIVRGPEGGTYTVVSGVARFSLERRNAIVDVVFAEDASPSDYGPNEREVLVASKPVVHLPYQLTNWLDGLITSIVEPCEVWLFGSRADGGFQDDSDWDLLLKGSPSVVHRLRTVIKRVERGDVDLFVLEDGALTAFHMWSPTKQFTPDNAWHQLSEDYAEYNSNKLVRENIEIRRGRAVRLWPHAIVPA